jgi:hypothetical protein
VELTYADAAADGLITPEEIAVHYAPEINAAVNVLISGAGKGDFITAVDFDGDFSALNNWENMASHPLNAVVYWSVQETDTHWFAGYYLYHPRDDAEIWLDRHENDMEGVMLAIPKGVDAFLPPQIMYTQGHGNVFFYTDGTPVMLEGSRHEGGIALDGDRPVIYVAPNGTVIVGKKFDPENNPYSFEVGGEVEQIFKKYGFSRGIYWKSGYKDYMHFSFFGT